MFFFSSWSDNGELFENLLRAPIASVVHYLAERSHCLFCLDGVNPFVVKKTEAQNEFIVSEAGQSHLGLGSLILAV